MALSDAQHCLQGLKQHAEDPAFQEKWRSVKQTAKAKAMAKVAELSGVRVCRFMLHAAWCT